MDDEVIIISLETGEAVKNVGELRENIKLYKETLDGLEIGSKEYNDTLIALQTNQAALKNAMHATTTDTNQQAVSMEQVSRAANGAGNSYNALVRQMALLDQEFRNTEDVAKRDVLGAQIKNLNAQLKEMDAQRGKFGRNVGNYQSALDGLGAAFKATAGSAGAVIPKVQGVTAGLKALSATPVIGILGLLASALTKVVGGLKSSEENTNRMNKALATFKPLADAATRIVQGLGRAISGVVKWVGDLLVKWGLIDSKLAEARVAMQEESQALVGLERQYMVETARLQAEMDELREKAADKQKYNAKQRRQFLEEAAAKEQEIFDKEVELAERKLELARQEASTTENSADTNQKLAELEADLISKRSDRAKTMRRLTREINATMREQGATAREVTEEIVQTEETAILSIENLLDRIAQAEKAGDEAREVRRKLQEDLDAESDRLYQEQVDAVQAMLDAQLAAEWDAAQEERRIQEQRINTFFAYADGVSGLADSIAAIYDAEDDANEEAAQKSKGFRTAAAIIDTISGAISAYMSTWSSELPLTAKAILAPINAASVLAAGYAQVKKIQQTKVGRGGGASVSTPAIASAPAVSAPIQQVRTITGQTEEVRLNQMAGSQRVYLVLSDLEAKQNDQRVRVQETTFG